MAQQERVNAQPIPTPILVPSNPQLEFTIDDGYGLDKNQNGIIDMPNSSEYVQRPLKVKFSLKGISQFQPNTSSPSPVNIPETPLIFRYVWRWSFYPQTDVKQNINLLPVPKAATANRDITGEKYADRLVTYSIGTAIEIELFDGTWKVKISKFNANDLQGTPIQNYEFTAKREDYLIVQLGDSYSSGEGAPEFDINRKLYWGDDGVGGTAHPQNVHRSSLTWGSVAALRIEAFGPQSSVTFINLAISGSLINDMPAQLNILSRVAGVRNVDAVFMSIGGNDAGFSNAMAAYLLREPIDNLPDLGPDFENIKNAIKTGKWRTDGFSDVGSVFLELVDFLVPHEWANRKGISGLASGYVDLNNRFLQLGIEPKKVYFLQYPDPFIVNAQNNEICGPVITELATYLGRKLEIGKKEQRHARENLITPLNKEISDFAQTAGWNIIDCENVMYGSAICQDERMSVRYKESKSLQGDHKGTLHPNKKGYKAMGDRAYNIFIRNNNLN